MGIEKYINKLTVILANGGIKYYNNDKVEETCLLELKRNFFNRNIRRVEAENVDDAICMIIFTDGNKYHIGIIDMFNETNYYLDNETDDVHLIEIDGNYFESRYVQNNMELSWQILNEFINNGEKSKKVNWCEE